MYDGIFEDFNIVKRHCKKNGNVDFEEFAVFELLENLHLQHGSVEAVQIVIEMLDAQRIRDCKNLPTVTDLEVINSDESNDNDNDSDSVIELKLSPKFHPVIDLTSNSCSNESVNEHTEKSKSENFNNNTENDSESEINNEDYEISDTDCHGLSDSDLCKQPDDEWNRAVGFLVETFEDAPMQLMQCLPMYKEHHSSNLNQLEEQNIPNDVAEVNEMLEENNNDPNNNLEERIFDEEPLDVNNIIDTDTQRMDNMQNFRNMHSNDALISEDPVPGCSKDTETELNSRVGKKSFPYSSVHLSPSPIPGCSKDFNNSNGLQTHIIFDESIQSDAVCIQEIVPWADLEIIYSILKKHIDSPNRKQLTLWDLMSQESSNTINCKRKQYSDTCIVSEKSLKLEDNNDFDESSLDSTTNSQINNITYKDISDSQACKISECNRLAFEVTAKNQNNQINNDDQSPKLLNFDEKNVNSSNNLLPSSNKIENCTSFIKTADAILDSQSSKLLECNELDANVEEKNQNSEISEEKKLLKTSTFEEKNLINSINCNNWSQLPTTNEVKNFKMLDKTPNVESDSKTFKTTEFNGFHFEVKEENQNNQESKNNFFSTILNFNEKNSCLPVKKVENNILPIKTTNSIAQEKVKDQFVSNNSIFTLPKNVQNFSFTGSAFKKERNETIVSGSLNDFSQSITETILKHPSPLLSFNDSFKKAENNSIFLKKCNFLYNDSKKKQFDKAKEIKISPNKRKNPDKIDVIKPAKLLFENAIHTQQIVKKSNLPTSYIRPATFNYINSKLNHDLKVKQMKDNNLMSIKSKIFLQNTSRISLPLSSRKSTPPSLSQKLNKSAKNYSMPVQSTSKTMPEPAFFTVSSNPMEIIDIGENISISTDIDLSFNSNEVPDRSIYNKLRSMFPDVKSSYVKEICINPPFLTNYNDKEFVLNMLIDHLLNKGHDHLQPVQNYVKQQTITTLSIDEQYEYLLGIFPDADPTYLRKFVEENINSKTVLEEFIQQKLETRDYPTKEQYLAKIKITEQQKQYTVDFNVEKFLELFPNPVNHFENEKRQCNYHPIAMEFLKSFFNKTKISTICWQYKMSKYNLSVTAKVLSELGSDMKSKRMSVEMPTEDIPLLQEIAFIKNKKFICNHINTLKEKEEQLFKELQKKNLLLTCQCCFNDECMPTKCSECNEGHVFCYECIIRGTESTLADGEAHVRCFTECKNEFSLATLQKVLPPTKFSVLLKKRQAAEVMAAEVDGLVSCPFCHFASIPPPEDKVFKCLNPECMKETCRQCKELNHIPLRCDEVIKADKARRLIEEKMTEALLRTCYQCKKQFYKEEGCNKMDCHCGASMCYLCDKPVTNYKHFNPQGGENSNLCPLWTDDCRLNAEAVIKVAEDTKKAVMKQNPDLNIDTSSLLPKLPPKKKGPHDNIANANQLPEHVRRIAGAAP